MKDMKSRLLGAIALSVGLLALIGATSVVGVFKSLIVDGRPAGNISTKTVTLTNNQIKGLPITPVVLVSAPISGYYNNLIAATLVSKTTAGAYTNINGTYSALYLYHFGYSAQWDAVPLVNDSGGTGATKITAILGSAANNVVNLGPYVDTPTSGATGWVLPNPKLYASVSAKQIAVAMDNNGSGALTGGNAANSLTVVLYYSVIALP